MKKLEEFDTLADAQAYEHVTSKMISGSQMKIFVVMNGLYNYFKYHSQDMQIATYDEIKGGEFNFINGHPSNVSSLIDSMISYATTNENAIELKNYSGATVSPALALETLKQSCIEYANKTSKPHELATQQDFDLAKSTETLLALDKKEQYVATVTSDITTHENYSVKIYHRYGPSIDDLTDWIDCATVNNMRYKQDTHKVTIAACNHAVREFKVVHPLSVTVTVN